MLSQIPGVSYVTSELIINEYKDLPTLIEKLKENPKCLDHIVAPLSNGKTRKISKTAYKNVYQYLLHILPT